MDHTSLSRRRNMQRGYFCVGPKINRTEGAAPTEEHLPDTFCSPILTRLCTRKGTNERTLCFSFSALAQSYSTSLEDYDRFRRWQRKTTQIKYRSANLIIFLLLTPSPSQTNTRRTAVFFTTIPVLVMTCVYGSPDGSDHRVAHI